MKINCNQYFTNITKENIEGKNVVVCVDVGNRHSILIRNTENAKETVSFENEFFLMKNNIILEINEKEIGNYHVLICKKKDENSIAHFERVCDYLFIKNDNSLSADEMLKLFYSLETIFSVVSMHDKTLEIGLYGELSLINYLYEIGFDCYKSWHTDFFNKHDFEINEKTKLEVKSTIKDFRIHSFGKDQISRKYLNVFIVSCKLKPCEFGLSLYQLCKQTIALLDNKNQMLSIELLMKKLGLNEGYQGINCDKSETYEGMKLYNSIDIPKLVDVIPEGISNVRYDVDFSNIKSSDFDELRRFISV